MYLQRKTSQKESNKVISSKIDQIDFQMKRNNLRPNLDKQQICFSKNSLSIASQNFNQTQELPVKVRKPISNKNRFLNQLLQLQQRWIIKQTQIHQYIQSLHKTIKQKDQQINQVQKENTNLKSKLQKNQKQKNNEVRQRKLDNKISQNMAQFQYQNRKSKIVQLSNQKTQSISVHQSLINKNSQNVKQEIKSSSQNEVRSKQHTLNRLNELRSKQQALHNKSEHINESDNSYEEKIIEAPIIKKKQMKLQPDQINQNFYQKEKLKSQNQMNTSYLPKEIRQNSIQPERKTQQYKSNVYNNKTQNKQLDVASNKIEQKVVNQQKDNSSRMKPQMRHQQKDSNIAKSEKSEYIQKDRRQSEQEGQRRVRDKRYNEQELQRRVMDNVRKILEENRFLTHQNTYPTKNYQKSQESFNTKSIQSSLINPSNEQSNQNNRNRSSLQNSFINSLNKDKTNHINGYNNVNNNNVDNNNNNNVNNNNNNNNNNDNNNNSGISLNQTSNNETRNNKTVSSFLEYQSLNQQKLINENREKLIRQTTTTDQTYPTNQLIPYQTDKVIPYQTNQTNNFINSPSQKDVKMVRKNSNNNKVEYHNVLSNEQDNNYLYQSQKDSNQISFIKNNYQSNQHQNQNQHLNQNQNQHQHQHQHQNQHQHQYQHQNQQSRRQRERSLRHGYKSSKTITFSNQPQSGYGLTFKQFQQNQFHSQNKIIIPHNINKDVSPYQSIQGVSPYQSNQGTPQGSARMIKTHSYQQQGQSQNVSQVQTVKRNPLTKKQDKNHQQIQQDKYLSSLNKQNKTNQNLEKKNILPSHKSNNKLSTQKVYGQSIMNSIKGKGIKFQQERQKPQQGRRQYLNQQDDLIEQLIKETSSKNIIQGKDNYDEHQQQDNNFDVIVYNNGRQRVGERRKTRLNTKLTYLDYSLTESNISMSQIQGSLYRDREASSKRPFVYESYTGMGVIVPIQQQQRHERESFKVECEDYSVQVQQQQINENQQNQREIGVMTESVKQQQSKSVKQQQNKSVKQEQKQRVFQQSQSVRMEQQKGVQVYTKQQQTLKRQNLQQQSNVIRQSLNSKGQTEYLSNSRKQQLNTTKQQLNTTKQQLNTSKQQLNTTKQQLNTTNQPVLNQTKQPVLNQTKQSLVNQTKQSLQVSQPKQLRRGLKYNVKARLLIEQNSQTQSKQYPASQQLIDNQSNMNVNDLSKKLSFSSSAASKFYYLQNQLQHLKKQKQLQLKQNTSNHQGRQQSKGRINRLLFNPSVYQCNIKDKTNIHQKSITQQSRQQSHKQQQQHKLNQNKKECQQYPKGNQSSIRENQTKYKQDHKTQKYQHPKPNQYLKENNYHQENNYQQHKQDPIVQLQNQSNNKIKTETLHSKTSNKSNNNNTKTNNLKQSQSKINNLQQQFYCNDSPGTKMVNTQNLTSKNQSSSYLNNTHQNNNNTSSSKHNRNHDNKLNKQKVPKTVSSHCYSQNQNQPNYFKKSPIHNDNPYNSSSSANPKKSLSLIQQSQGKSTLMKQPQFDQEQYECYTNKSNTSVPFQQDTRLSYQDRSRLFTQQPRIPYTKSTLIKQKGNINNYYLQKSPSQSQQRQISNHAFKKMYKFTTESSQQQKNQSSQQQKDQRYSQQYQQQRVRFLFQQKLREKQKQILRQRERLSHHSNSSQTTNSLIDLDKILFQNSMLKSYNNTLQNKIKKSGKIEKLMEKFNSQNASIRNKIHKKSIS